ncbi:hypothetical protein [Mesoflavibacter sp. SCSIO 43206]|uniref:hypothetical protein n=1 Tax=Mesoflavibacter sp. SCSIO 43206 TaxID=2779362 RepID=UPI001CA8CDD6|nr:hypothetical protein [Mesoflavibacter sp. SCSIO 43206]UAB75600.1 hypothetical protein INR78_01025 [Mesoflavibacter sp. SCSIO 43206]
MIKIIVENNKKTTNDLLGDFDKSTTNESLNIAKEYLKETTKNMKCDIHGSESKMTLTIKMSKNGQTEIIKSEYCCDKFLEKFK